MSVNVKIDEQELVEMLVERVRFWKEDESIISLFRDMYQSYADGGYFDGMELDIPYLVDNDCVNNCSVVSEGDEEYKGIKFLYDQNGLGDISCDKDYNNGYNFIEAYRDGMFLVRY